MISVTGIFLYMLVTCYLLGFCCYELLAGFRRKQEKAFREELHRTWTGCVYAGVAFTVFYAQMFSIFYKVGLFANVLLLILAAAGVIFYRDRFAEELKRLWNQKNIKRAMGLPHVICMAAPPQFNANAQLICLNGQQSQAIDTFLNASSTDDGQVGTLYRVYLWHYLYVIQLAVFKFFISYWF